MGKDTGISWTDSTFNGVRGCEKYSAGCKFCYADRDSKRNPGLMGEWGPLGKRRVAKHNYWQSAIKWNRAAFLKGVRTKVFAYSFADVFEQHDRKLFWSKAKESDPDIVVTKDELLGFGGDESAVMDHARLKLFETIRNTPNLDWLLLTKRIEHVLPTLRRCADICQGQPASKVWETLSLITNWLNGNPPKNVWMGTSVEDQETANYRIPFLLKVPASIRWVSYEPALGPVDFSRWMACYRHESGEWHYGVGPDYPHDTPLDWIIVGGESGPHARPFDLAWARSTRDQCRAAGVACYIKQLGAVPFDSLAAWKMNGHKEPSRRYAVEMAGYVKKDRAGADPAEWPEDLRVRQFPKFVI